MGLHEKVTTTEIAIPTRDAHIIPARVHTPELTSTKPLPTYIFYHGGGFIYGTPFSEDAACARIAAKTPALVISICYRHTPQVAYPVPLHDAFDGFDWAVSNLIVLVETRRRWWWAVSPWGRIWLLQLC